MQLTHSDPKGAWFSTTLEAYKVRETGFKFCFHKFTTCTATTRGSRLAEGAVAQQQQAEERAGDARRGAAG
jgi:hypothetical protein